MKNVILICDSFSSANFHVMTAVIRSLGESVHIHAIADTNEKETSLGKYADITYYPVHSWRISLIERLQRIKPKLFSRILDSLFCRATKHINNFHRTSYEKEMERVAKRVITHNDINSVFTVCFRFYHHRIALNLLKEISFKWYQFWLDPYSNRYDQKSKLWRMEAELLEWKFFEKVQNIYALPEVFCSNRPINSFKEKLITFQIPYLVNRDITTQNKNIIFAGSFVKGIREPEPVLSLLLSIFTEIDKEIVFHFYVPDKTDYQKYVTLSRGRLLFHNYVNHDHLYKLLSECYMLLNVGNYGSTQMPSKTVEYVSFRKPILFFYKGKHDSSIEYLKKYPEVCMVDIDSDKSLIVKLLVGFINGKHNVIKYEELIKIESFYESTPEYLRSVIELT